MGPGSVQEGPVPNLSPPGKPNTGFAKVLEDRKTPQELRPAETRRSEKQEVRERLPDGEKPVPKARKTSERETAMLQFMDSMESEFGITPARMLEALADLDNEALVRPPEDTASDVIANLELPSEDEPQATEMYLQFLQQWQDLRRADETADPQAAASAAGLVAGGAILQAGLDVKQGAPALDAGERRALLNRSLDRMNDQFFMRGPLADAGTDATKTAETLSRLSELGFERVEPRLVADPRLAPMPAAELAVNPARLPAEDALAFADGPAPLPGEAGGLSELEGLLRQLNADPLAFRAEAHAAVPKAAAVAEPKVLDVSALQIPGFGALAAATPADAGETALGADTGEAEGDGGGGLADGRGEANLMGADFAQLLRAEPGAKAAGAAGAAPLGAFALNDAEAQANLEALKDQTRIMVREGGGEARIRLNQEGLGEVQLKVLVHDGKVNVELKTDNADAKKLLESSIADLKQSLSAQKLSVDNVKVDVGTSDAQSQQRPMDFQQDPGRQQARQAMEQFRHESASRRDPFFEMSGIKAYGRKRAEPEPIPAAGPRVMSGRGERMNLVA